MLFYSVFLLDAHVRIEEKQHLDYFIHKFISSERDVGFSAFFWSFQMDSLIRWHLQSDCVYYITFRRKNVKGKAIQLIICNTTK